MKLIVNGKEVNLEKKGNYLTLDSAIKQLGFNKHLIVIEFNGTILTPKKWSDQQLSDGDILEIVTIVGGGS